MPNSIDNKIVEMQFDNANFEKNVKQSIKTLEQLNKALELNDAAKGFEQMEKAANDIDFSKITKAAEMIEQRFSAAGIAGAAFIERMTNTAINAVTNLGRKVVGLAKSGGIARSLKLEHAQFMLNGLLKDASKAAQIISGPVNNAVSGTAYGLDAAANAAAQLFASGVKDSGKLENALTAISGVAAMTGAQYEEIADIFTSAAGKGRVMTMEFNRINQRGVAAFAVLAEHLHKTEAEVRDMATKGKISFDMFAEAMNKAFSEQAKKANETFTGAMSNVKAALSRIGAKVATPAIETLRKIFVSLIKVINQINTILSSTIIKRINSLILKLETLAVGILNQKKFMTAVEGTINNLAKAFDLLGSYLAPIKAAFKEIFPKSGLDTMIEVNKEIDKLLDRMSLTDEQAAMLQMTFEGLFSIFDIGLTILNQFFDVLNEIAPGLTGIYDSTDSLATKVLKVTSFIGFLIKKFSEWLKENNLLKAGIALLTGSVDKLGNQTNILTGILKGIAVVIGSIVYVFYKIGSAVGDFLYQVYKLPIVQAIIDDIKNAVVLLGKMAEPVFEMVCDGLLSMLDAAQQFAEGGYLTKGLEKLNGVLNASYWGFKNAIGTVGAFFNIFKKGDNAVTKIEKVTVALEKNYASVNALSDSVDGVTTTVVNGADQINNSLDGAERIAKGTEDELVNLSKAGKLFAVGFGASMISATVNIARAFRNVAKVAGDIRGATTSIKYFFDQLQLNLRIKTLIALSGAIIIFAASLWILCQVPPARLALAAVAIGTLTYVMTQCAKILSSNELSSVYKFQAATAGLINLAAAVFLLAQSVKTISVFKDDWKGLLTGLGGMLAIMTMLVGAMIALGRWQENAIQGTFSILAFAGAIYIIMASLQKIQDLDLPKIKQVIPLLLEIMGGLALISLSMALVISPFGGVAFLGIVAGIVLLCEELSRLGGIDPKALKQVIKIIKTIGDIFEALLIVLTFVKLMEAINTVLTIVIANARGIVGNLKNIFGVAQQGVKYIGVASIIISIAGAIYLIGDTLIKLSAALSADPSAFIAAGITIVAMFACIEVLCSSLIAAAGKVAAASAAAASIGPILLGVGVAIMAMAGAIALFGNMPTELFNAGLVNLGEVMLILVSFIGILSIIQNSIGPMLDGSMKVMVGISIFLAVMVTSIGVLGILAAADLDAYLAGLGSVSAILVLMAVVFAAVSKMGEMSTQATVSVGLMIGVFLSLAALAAVVGNMKNTAETLSLSLAALILGVGFMALILKGLATFADDATMGMVALAGITGCMLLLAGVASILDDIDTKKFYDNIVILGNAIALLSIAIAVLGAFEAVTGPGVVILIALAGALLLISTAAIVFGVGAKMIGEGMTVIGTALGTLIKFSLQIPTLAENIALLAMSFGVLAVGIGVLALTTVPLSAFGVACSMVALPIMGISAAVISFTTGLMMLQQLNLSGLMANMIRLGQAVSFVVERILEFAVFSVIATAAGQACYVLGGGLTVLGLGLNAVTLAFNLAMIGLNSFAEALDFIGNIIVKVCEYVSNMATDLQNLGTSTVYDIYAALVNAGQSILPSAGYVMSEYVITGFKNGISDNSSGAGEEIATALADGIIFEIERREGDLYDAGYDMVEEIIKGMEAAGEINSPSKKTAEDGKWLVEGLTGKIKDLNSDIEESGAGMAEAVIKGIEDTAGIHSRADATEYDGQMMADGLTETLDENQAAGAESGAAIADATGGTIFDRLVDWLKKCKDAIAEFFANPLTFFGDKTGLGDFKNEYAKMIEEQNKELDKLTNKTKDSYIRLNDGTAITYKQYNEYRKKGREEERKRIEQLKEGTEALEDEIDALDANTKAGGKNSKAKKENEKANDGKTSAIDEETDSLGEEEEAMEDNTEALREMAEQIVVVTETYNTLKNATSWFGDKFKIARKSLVLMGDAFHTAFRTMEKDAEGNDQVVKKSVKEIYGIFYNVRKNIKHTTDKVSKGLYAFGAETDKLDKKLTKKLNKGSKSVKKAEKTVMKTGKTVIKVYEGYMKVFTKNGNNVEKMVVRLATKAKNLAKFAKEAAEFAKSFNADINEAQYVEDFTDNFRQIEKFFVKRKDLPQKIQNWLGDILSKFKNAGFKNAMNLLGKSIDGSGDYWKKTAQNTAYVADSMTQLAAALYDGSDAANEYWTQIARLEFLIEHGVEEARAELEEVRRAYLDRAMEALTEYYNTLRETLSGQFNPFVEFDKKTEDATKDLIGCLESQIAGFQTYGDMLIALAQRGADFNLMKDLADQGVEAYGIIENLVTMTEGQLALFNQYYRQIDSVKQRAADATIAALANARAMASIRAAARSGDLSDKQMKQQKKLAGEMADDMKAVANAVAYGYKDAKKQQKEYMKSLTKEEKKQYKKQLKDAKNAAKLEKAQAEAEKQRRAEEKAAKEAEEAAKKAQEAEEERINNVYESIKSYETLCDVMKQYASDAGVMAKVNEKLSKSLKGVYSNIGNNSDITSKWLSFGKQLGVEESDDADSFFSSLESTINSFRDGIKSALYDITKVFTKFAKSTEKYSLTSMITNGVSQLVAQETFGNQIERLAQMGYNSKLIEYIGKRFASDQAGALAEMEQLVKAGAQEIVNINTMFTQQENAMKKATQQSDYAVVESQHDRAKEAFDAASSRLAQAQANKEKAIQDYQNLEKDTYNKLGYIDSNEYRDYVRKYARKAKNDNLEEQLRQSMFMPEYPSSGYSKNNRWKPWFEQDTKDYKIEVTQQSEDLQRILTNAWKGKDRWGRKADANTLPNIVAVRQIAREQKAVIDAEKNEYEEKKKELTKLIEKDQKLLADSIKKEGLRAERELANRRISKNQKLLEQLEESYKQTSAYKVQAYEAEWAELKKTKKAEIEKAEAELQQQQAAYNAALAEWNRIKALRAQMEAEAELNRAYEKALLEINGQVSSYDDLNHAMNRARWSNDWLQRTYVRLMTALEPVSGALAYANAKFYEFNKGTNHNTIKNLSNVTAGFLRLASTLEATNEETGTFIENMGARLENYRNTLDQTIRGQTQLFDEFKKYSGDEATGATTYLDNMISQTEGLAEWLTNLETLTKRGVAKEVVEMFASEGQNSFEKVEAFAKATDAELAELNVRYKEYAGLAAEAADRALAAVAAAYSESAEAMQERIMNGFVERTKSTVEEAAYNAATMVVTGVKNGINKARPQLVAEIDGVATAISSTVAKTLTASEIEESIRKGLNTMSGTLQNSVGVIVTDFLDKVTQTSVSKFKMAVDQCRAYVEKNLPKDYTITIHVDTSEMDAAVARMNYAINGMNYVAVQTSASVAQSQANQSQGNEVTVGAVPTNNTTVNYTQNNYSPTALSRTEIYRQTQNQLQTIRGVVSASP